MAQKSDGATKNIVLGHGGFVDGSGWEDVYQILKRDGYNVSVVQNPTISLTGACSTSSTIRTKRSNELEIGLAGVAAAITSAVHHATGVRVRELPIKIADLLAIPNGARLCPDQILNRK